METRAINLSRLVSGEVRAELARQELTQEDLARKLGRSQNYGSMRLRGEASFTLDDLGGACDLFGLDPDVLLRRALASETRTVERVERTE